MNKGALGKAVCLGGIVVAGAGLSAGFLSRYWIELDVFSHLTLHFIIAILALAIAYFTPRSLRLAVALVVMATGMITLGSWGKLSADQLLVEAGTPVGGRALKIMHFNIWGRNQSLDDVASEVARIDPDVLFLTEVRKRGQELTAILDKRFAYRLPKKDRLARSLTMYSKYPFSASQRLRSGDGLSIVRGTLGADWRYLNIVGTHLTRPPEMRDQEQEILTAVKLVKALSGASVVVGDFNATPHSAMLELFQSQTGLKRVTFLPTWPALGLNLPQFAIDHIFISDGLSLAAPAIVGRYAGSDHLPVAASILVPQ
ncbi:MAG: endonuclease/exonuclease/phosphatase family protein [Anderseniella sp.]